MGYSVTMNGIYIKRPNRKRRNVAVIITMSVLVIISLVTFSDRIANVSLGLTRPFQAAVWGAGDSAFGWTLSLLRAGDLKREMDSLTEEKERLTAEVVGLRSLREENEALRRVLELDMDKDFDLVMATVSGKDIMNETIVIDRGSNDGVSEGMPVVTDKRVVIGRVTKTFDDFSKVMLVTHEKSAFESEVQGRNFIGLVEGSGGSGAKLTLIPKDKEVSKGDALITTSLSGSFPQGLFVGLIKEVKNMDSESFQEAEIAPFFNIRRLNRVFVITNQK